MFFNLDFDSRWCCRGCHCRRRRCCCCCCCSSKPPTKHSATSRLLMLDVILHLTNRPRHSTATVCGVHWDYVFDATLYACSAIPLNVQWHVLIAIHVIRCNIDSQWVSVDLNTKHMKNTIIIHTNRESNFQCCERLTFCV